MIKFYSEKKEYGWLSNFSSHAILIDNQNWLTVEHYFQAMKAMSNADKEWVKSATSPGQAKSRGKSITLRHSDWNQIKYDIMKRALLAKFTQHSNLYQELLNTGEKELIEDSPYDYEWGCGKDGSGQNKLGKLLMEVRDALKSNIV